MNDNIKRTAIIKKSRARRYAMQNLYQYLLTLEDNDVDDTTSIEALIEQWHEQDDLSDYDETFFATLITNAITYRGNIDLQIANYSSRPLKQLGIVEHAILLVGAVELQREPTPAKVVINEAIILAKSFAGEDSHKFINSVLDKIHKS